MISEPSPNEWSVFDIAAAAVSPIVDEDVRAAVSHSRLDLESGSLTPMRIGVATPHRSNLRAPENRALISAASFIVITIALIIEVCVYECSSKQSYFLTRRLTPHLIPLMNESNPIRFAVTYSTNL